MKEYVKGKKGNVNGKNDLVWGKEGNVTEGEINNKAENYLTHRRNDSKGGGKRNDRGWKGDVMGDGWVGGGGKGKYFS